MLSRAALPVALCALWAVAAAGASASDYHQPTHALLAKAQSVQQAGANATTGGALSACGKKWTLYKQCDQRWGKDRLGTSSNTICAAGCAMTSVSMALATYGVLVDKHTAEPEDLNVWLTKHGGYIEGDLLVWNAVHHLKNDKFDLKVAAGRISKSEMKGYVVRLFQRLSPLFPSPIADTENQTGRMQPDDHQRSPRFVRPPGVLFLCWCFETRSLTSRRFRQAPTGCW
jgi:hypothetical protein